MDNRVNMTVHGWEVFEDETCLSIDLPDEDIKHPRPVSSRNSFEFYPAVNPHRNSAEEDVIIFCGRIMNLKTQSLPDQRDSFLPLRSSDRLSRKPSRSQSFKFEKPLPLLPATTGGSFRYDQSSTIPKNHRSLIGLAKIPPEMELGDMKRRQGRRAPAPMFPDGEVADSYWGGRKSHKTQVKPKKSRTPPLGMLSTALFSWVPNVC